MTVIRMKEREIDDIREENHRAYSVIDEVAANLQDKSLKETFLSSHYVQKIRQKAKSER